MFLNKFSFFTIFSFISLSAFAQIGIGTDKPNKSAELHLESNKKGFLPPRMSTQARNEINSGVFAEGLIIYNTDEKCLNIYNGTIWINLCQGTPPITALSCDSPTNSEYLGNGLETGISYTNTSPSNNQIIRVYYEGGNGEAFDSESIMSNGVTNLTATVEAGNLNNGDGFVDFIITGTPTATGTASFSLSFLGVSAPAICAEVDVNVSTDPFVSAALCNETPTFLSFSEQKSFDDNDLGNVAISGDGNTMAVIRGDYGANANFCNNNSLCTYISIFNKDNSGNWTETNTITSDDTDIVLMGSSRDQKTIEFSNDGNTLIASASRTGLAQSFTGRIVIFENNNGTWSNTATINTLEARSSRDDLSISGDGNTIIFKKRIYSKSGVNWTNTPSFTDIPNLGFIFETSISDDGKKVVFSHNTILDEIPVSIPNNVSFFSKEVTLFDLNESNGQWEENSVTLEIPLADQATLHPSYPIPTNNIDNHQIVLGNALISGDGSTITYQYKVNETEAETYYGFFYIFRFNNSSNQWEQIFKLDLDNYEPILSNNDNSNPFDPLFHLVDWGQNYRISEDGNKLFFGHYDMFQECDGTLKNVTQDYPRAGYISYFKYDGSTYNHERVIAPSNLGSRLYSWVAPFDVSSNGDAVVFVNDNIPGISTGFGRIAVFD
jgi:hypothetical protein